MKIKCKKVLCIFLILLTLFNFICSNKSYAASDTNAKESLNGWDVAGLAIDGAAGLLLMPAKLLLFTTGSIARAIASEVAEVGATKSESVMFLSLEDIFFHNVEGKIPIINVNFFKPITSNGKNDVIVDIRNNIASWYYSIRNLAIIISLLVLVYIGIRMAMSTLAEDKATYKKMLTDWIVGFITIFLLHYIIIATIYINEALVRALIPSSGAGFSGDIIKDYLDNILMEGLSTVTFTKGMASAVVYVGMTAMTFMFLYTYAKRMITVAFLIIIAPIITVTYSIDKIGDRKISSVKYMVKGICI